MGKIAIGIVGVGNCASSLLQGIEFYRAAADTHVGLMHRDLCGYGPSDIDVVCAFDIDQRRSGPSRRSGQRADTDVRSLQYPQAGLRRSHAAASAQSRERRD